MQSQWLTAKKRGRDDEQIERDRVVALQARRKPGKRAVKTKQSLSRKNRSRMDSLAGLVVDDDDEGEDRWVGSSSSEDEVHDVDGFTKTKGSKKATNNDSEDDDSNDLPKAKPPKTKFAVKKKASDSDVSSDESDTFFRPYKKRTSVPPPPRALIQKGKMLRKKGPALKKEEKGEMENRSSSPSKFDDNASTKVLEKKRPALKTKVAEVNDLCSSSSNDDDAARDFKIFNVMKKAKAVASKRFKPKATAKLSLESIASNRSIHFTKNVDNVISLLKESSDDDSLNSASKLFDDGDGDDNKSNCFAAAPHGDLEDTPVVPAAIRKKLSKNSQKRSKIRNVDATSGASKKPAANNSIISTDDYCSDIDEAVAIACALEESMKKAATKVSAASSPGGSLQEEHVDLQDDSSSQDDGDDKDEEEYFDEDARAASSILATANELSAQVLKTMAGWSKGATDGIIVDGALALGSLGNAPADTDHTWITQELMKEILPGVTLADYQLIGINWMALLHGMKCEVEGTKKYTNVNGILADGTLALPRFFSEIYFRV